MLNFSAFAKKKELEITHPIPIAHITHGLHTEKGHMPDGLVEDKKIEIHK